MNDSIMCEKVESSFVEWMKQNATPLTSVVHSMEDDNSDLKSIAEAIGKSRVVALSEGFHNCKEMMSFHYRLIRYLIEHHGFNTVMTESGLPESRLIYDYVHGVDSSEDVWGRGLNKMYSAWKEGRQLIEFMRQYNETHSNVLRYYGTDIGGFYNNWKFPLEKILDYLKTVDHEYCTSLSRTLEPFMDFLSTGARLNYSEKLTPTLKNELAVILDEAVTNFDRNKDLYSSRSTTSDFQWARQSMVSMQLAENYYRNFDNMKNPLTSKYVGLNGREIAMARSAAWVLEQRENARVIWIEHVVHTKTKTQHQEGVWGFFTPAAQILKQMLREELFVIGMVYGGGKFWNKWQKPEMRFIDEIPPWNESKPSLERCMSKCGIDKFFVHWSNIPGDSVAQKAMWKTFSMRENDYFIEIEPNEWNGSVYLDKVGPATAVESVGL